MKKFMGKNFILSSDTAEKLFHQYAEQMPVIDYHCHINPQEIVDDRVYKNITQAWLEGDHYKWRLMRAIGAPEEEVTGSAPERVKFQRFVEALEHAPGNPLYHWSHMELQRYMGYDGVLSAETAEEVWKLCEEQLKDLSVRKIIKNSKVEVIVTTDDPIADLEAHRKIRAEHLCSAKVLPSWRPDQAMAVERKSFSGYMKSLGEAAGVEIKGLDSLKAALLSRLEYFQAAGCVGSDHGLSLVSFLPSDDKTIDCILKKGLAGETVSGEEAERYHFALLVFLAQEYAKRGWVMEMHLGPLRSVSTKNFRELGPDTGFDCIDGYGAGVSGLVGFLDYLQERGALPKTVLFSLNPNDNALLDAAVGCFTEAGVLGKIQHGAAWWFNDTKLGMEQHLKSLASISALGTFIGMLTDSRSYLSYTRHEYFRRILCNVLGAWVERGEFPNDLGMLSRLVQNISYYNAKNYFGF